MTGKISGFFEGISTFLGGGRISQETEKDGHEVTQQPDDSGESTNQRRGVVAGDGGRAVGEEGPTSRKRAGEDISEQGGYKKARLSERRIRDRVRDREQQSHARRLTGDYGNPADARPIAIPTKSWEPAEPVSVPASSSRKQEQKTSSPTGGLGNMQTYTHKKDESVRSRFQPRNSLNSPTAYAAKSSSHIQGRSNQNHAPQRALTRPQNPPVWSDARLASKGGDGFTDAEASDRPNKRPKLEMVSDILPRPSPDNRKNPIDLTGGSHGSVDEQIVQLNRKNPLGSKHRQSAHSPDARPPPQVFDNSEWNAVDNNIRLDHKKRRKPKAGPPSSQNSGRATPVGSNSGQASKTLHHPHNASSVEDYEIDRAERPQSRDRPAEARKGSDSRPRIDLTHGFETFGNSERKATDNKQIQATGSLIQRTYGKTDAKSAPAQTHPDPLPRRSISQDDVINGSVDIATSRPREGRKTPRLSSTFVRDGETASPNRQQNAEQASRTSRPPQQPPDQVATSSDSKHYGSESPDQLSGATTIQSPESKAAVESRSRAGYVPSQRRVKSPDSDPRPSALHQANSRKARANVPEKPSPRANSDQDIEIVAIRRFHAASCILTSDLIELEYNADEEQIYVKHNGQRQQVPGRGQLVAIGDSEVSKAVTARGSCKVMLKGRSASISDGQFCLEFNNAGDVGWFANALQAITHDKLGFQSYDSLESLDKAFESNCRTILASQERRLRAQANEKAAVRQAASTAIRQASDRHNRGDGGGVLQIQRPTETRANAMRRQQNDDDEQIKYDYGSEGEPPSGQHKTNEHQPRQLTKGRTGTERRTRGTSDAVRSPYFPETRAGRRETLQPTRRTRTPTQPPERWTQVNNPEPWTRPVVYPTQGLRRVTVDFEDLERLDESEFLNDNVISFALRKIEENMAEEHRSNVHFFNTFFYTSLTTKNGKKAFNYDAVKRWTKSTDLMSVPYIVVPINDNYHWYVAIICNLDNLGREFDDDVGRNDEKADEDEDETDRTASAHHTADAMYQLSLSDKGKSSQTVAEPPTSPPAQSSSARRRKKGPAPLRKYYVDTPVIITLDSFGSQHTAVARQLKDYISAEANEKRGIHVEREQIQGMTAKGIPEQTNFCDCGVYLVGYIEEFAKDPRDFVTKVLTRKLDKDADFKSFDPSGKRAEIRNDLLALHEKQAAEHKAAKSAKKVAGKQEAETASKPNATAPKAPPPTRPPKTRSEQPAKPPAQPLTNRASPQAQSVSNAPTPEVPNEESDKLELSIPRPLSASRAQPVSRPSSASRHYSGMGGLHIATKDSSPLHDQPTASQEIEHETVQLKRNTGRAGSTKHHEPEKPQDIVSQLDDGLQQQLEGELEQDQRPLGGIEQYAAMSPQQGHELSERGKPSSGRSSAEAPDGRRKQRRRSAAAVINLEDDEVPASALEVPESQESVVMLHKQRR
ncbi:uncharacterized protein LTR77_007971 [Saxophila tyrrhenica]|uniref:Ubiquitin-like protease family profile domain-containing protein n=1 Tax=Saxophila tyrrhenica TaxID=1690608 RepID=A0AAV9P1I4_9PEZI|nr:hypothetical protein LTR77_007971 [Saxophila tyrrhenica]